MASKAVKEVGEGSFKIDQSFVDQTLSDMGQLMREARIVPHFKDGKTDGFKVFNIKSNSLFKTIGIENGDIIQRVNGMDISGPEQGLQIFETLRNEKDITIDLTRRGRKTTLNYTIQ